LDRGNLEPGARGAGPEPRDVLAGSSGGLFPATGIINVGLLPGFVNAARIVMRCVASGHVAGTCQGCTDSADRSFRLADGTVCGEPRAAGTPVRTGRPACGSLPFEHRRRARPAPGRDRAARLYHGAAPDLR